MNRRAVPVSLMQRQATTRSILFFEGILRLWVNQEYHGLQGSERLLPVCVPDWGCKVMVWKQSTTHKPEVVRPGKPRGQVS